MRAIRLTLVAILAIVLMAAIEVDWSDSNSALRTAWQSAVTPGMLSQSHAFLSSNCVACHTAVKGVEPARCIACHADNTALLQRQPTAFHVNIQICGGCHMEHQGGKRMPTTMDHALLAKAGHQELNKAAQSHRSDNSGLSEHDVQVAATILKDHTGMAASTLERETQMPEAQECNSANGCAQTHLNGANLPATSLPQSHPRIPANESMLSCAACHQTKDRHQGFFGNDCAQCHVTKQWTIADFRHPSVRSTECAQCHKPPPSHTMMHFPMMSARIAGEPNAKVHQCFLCHQTTSWNDIRGKGWFKHH